MEKKWYESKLLWIGVLTSAVGILEVLTVWLEAAQFQPQDFTMLIVGVLTVVMRVWFTDTKLVS